MTTTNSAVPAQKGSPRNYLAAILGGNRATTEDPALKANPWYRLRLQIRERVQIGPVIASALEMKPMSGVYFPCPFDCARDALLRVNTRHQEYRCERCKRAGDAASFVALFRGISVTEALRQLASDSNLPIPTTGELEYEHLCRDEAAAKVERPRIGAGYQPASLVNGYLTIHRDGSAICLGAWPHIRASRRQSDGTWQAITEEEAAAIELPGFEVKGNLPATSDECWKTMAWLETMPEGVRREVVNVSFHNYATLRFLAITGKPGLELCTSGGRFWVFAIVHARDLGFDIPPADYGRLASLKRTEIAQIFGFPPTKQIVRIAAKFDTGTIMDTQYILQLRSLWAKLDVAKLLAHVPQVNMTSMFVAAVERIRPYLTSTLLEEIERDHSAGLEYQEFLANRIAHYFDQWTREHPEIPFPILRTMYDFERVRERFRVRKGGVDRVFPESPVPVVEGIRHISNSYLLREEGWKCHNCVASYADQAADGKSFFYRVTKPERATVQIAWKPEITRWAITEIKAPFNRPVKRETEAYVNAWLESADEGRPKPR